MLDLRKAAKRDLGEADICIIGGGAAGITLALELESTGRRVVLLEAGGAAYDAEVQRLFEGEVAGDRFPPLRDTRLGALGGSTGVWAGFCRPLEEADFAPRHGSPGWPFPWSTIDPYWRRAHAVCRIGDYDYDPQRWSARLGQPLLVANDGPVRSLVFHLNALRFGAAYRQRLQDSRSVELLLNAPVKRLGLSRDGERVEHIDIGTPDGGELRLRPGRVVLAAGGIENARLLLLTGSRPEAAPGNGAGLVGRFFTDHPFVEPGYLVLDGPGARLDHYFPQAAGGPADAARIRGALSLDPRLVAREGLLNGAILLHPRYEAHDAFASPEVKSFLEACARLCGKSVPGGAARDLARSLAAPGKVATALLRKLLVRHGPARRWRLRMLFETESAFGNRVTLGTRRDRFGRACARVEWRLTERDLHSMRRFTSLVSEGLQQDGIGRINLTIADHHDGWRGAAIGGKHHMGTTRMHPDPRQGVVDADSRVHGTSNLYVAGSSVFPSGGFANPTLTIVALALRLADHLRQPQ